MSAMSESALAGVRVVEVGNFMAAPFCTLQLADLGAEVVKIENPDGGDQVRATAPFLEGESSSFIRLNRNKRSLALDLKLPRGKEVFRRLIERADVVVENLRPGTMADLELDYRRLSELNPRLVYVAASGWPGRSLRAAARARHHGAGNERPDVDHRRRRRERSGEGGRSADRSHLRALRRARRGRRPAGARAHRARAVHRCLSVRGGRPPPPNGSRAPISHPGRGPTARVRA